MIQIQYTKQALKDLAKLDKKIENLFYKRLEIFMSDPGNSILNIHPLKGKYLGKFSFNVSGDFRCVFISFSDDIAIIHNIGTHSQLY